jgi:hypothetical protein
VTPVLVLLALLSGCALVDGAADLTNRAVAGAAGRETTPVGNPLSFHLQLALLSDRVVTQIVQEAETPLDAVDDPPAGGALAATPGLRLRDVERGLGPRGRFIGSSNALASPPGHPPQSPRQPPN